MTRKSTIIWRLSTILYLAIVAFLCFAPSDTFPQVKEWSFFIPVDKLVHFSMFIPLPIMFYASVGRRKGSLKRIYLRIILILLISCIIAGSTELLQGLSPNRSTDFYDFIADTVGIAFSCLLLVLYLKLTFGKSQIR